MCLRCARSELFDLLSVSCIEVLRKHRDSPSAPLGILRIPHLDAVSKRTLYLSREATVQNIKRVMFQLVQEWQYPISKVFFHSCNFCNFAADRTNVYARLDWATPHYFGEELC